MTISKGSSRLTAGVRTAEIEATCGAALTHPLQQPKPMSLDDFEDLLADEPEEERWELICGRVVRMMVGARWEHNLIVGNIAGGMNT